jgi:hypothetical protein
MVEDGLGALAAVEAAGPCRGGGVAAVCQSWRRNQGTVVLGRSSSEAPPKPCHTATRQRRWHRVGATGERRWIGDKGGVLDEDPTAQINFLKQREISGCP